MKPLKSRRNPVIAGLVGFFFGAIGMMVYLRTWKDTGILAAALAVGVALVSLAPAAALPMYLGFAAYGVARVSESNKQLARAQSADPNATVVAA